MAGEEPAAIMRHARSQRCDEQLGRRRRDVLAAGLDWLVDEEPMTSYIHGVLIAIDPRRLDLVVGHKSLSMGGRKFDPIGHHIADLRSLSRLVRRSPGP